MTPLQMLQQSIALQMAADPGIALRMSKKAKSVLATISMGAMLAAVAVAPTKAHAQDPNAERGFAGQLIGGIVGSLLGSGIGGGNGKMAATAAGAILGSVVGDAVQNGSKAVPAPQQASAQRVVYVQQPVQQVQQVARPAQRSGPGQYDTVTFIETPASAYNTSSNSAPSDDRGVSGSLVGGATGALLGSRIGKGNGKLAATAAMGIVGAIVGDSVQNSDLDRRAQLAREAARRPTVAQIAPVNSIQIPSPEPTSGVVNSLSYDERQQMDTVTQAVTQSRQQWMGTLANSELGKNMGASKVEMTRLKTAEHDSRVKFIKERDDFGKIVFELNKAGYDIGRYATVYFAYTDVQPDSKISLAQAMSVQPKPLPANVKATAVEQKKAATSSYQSLSYGG